MEKVSVFLGGTCADSTWRSELIPMLGENIDYFNPQLGPGEWNDEAAKRERQHRENDDIRLYVLTPEAEGFYSYVEVIDDSNKRPSTTILCVLLEANGKKFEKHIEKCVKNTASLAASNGIKVFDNLVDLAVYLNSLDKEQIIISEIEDAKIKTEISKANLEEAQIKQLELNKSQLSNNTYNNK